VAPHELRSDERAALESVEGLVFDLQRYSLHDGPGLRTNVFFKGCPLRCRWCCNPESQAVQPELAFFEGRCFTCGDCLDVCQSGALRIERAGEQSDARIQWDPRACERCGRCVETCASGAFQWIGRRIRAGEVLDQALRDVSFYGEGGGITLTGGEPMLQPRFAKAILRLAQAEYIHTTMETSGHASWSLFDQVLPHVDLVLYDLKHMDSDHHEKGTGLGNELVLENARRMATWYMARGDRSAGRGMIIRLPLIPGFNMTAEDTRLTAQFARNLGVEEMHLLPYHRLGRSKYQALGRRFLGEAFRLAEEEEIEAMAGLVRSCGLSVRLGG
jgi:pyruvate formate lyase activating enzyme